MSQKYSVRYLFVIQKKTASGALTVTLQTVLRGLKNSCGAVCRFRREVYWWQ